LEWIWEKEGKVNIDESLNGSLPFTIYKPTRGWLSLRLGELWDYHELLYFLTWRDVKIRYKQTVLGISWVVLQPLITMAIFSVIFGQLAKLPSDGVPYPVFSYAGLLPWGLFSGALQRAGTSLVGNANLITKVYFPRLVIPISAVAAGMADFIISFAVFLGLMLYYKITFTWMIFTIPIFVLLAILTTLALSLWLSALNVQYRDVQYIIPFLIQVWMYASPVAYSAGLIPAGPWRIIYGLNPMAGVIQGFRWALLGTKPPDVLLPISVVMVLLFLVSGLYYFRHMEKTFADVV
jgi:lipopolysaccharide transport system permease protein